MFGEQGKLRCACSIEYQAGRVGGDQYEEQEMPGCGRWGQFGDLEEINLLTQQDVLEENAGNRG